MEQFWVYENWRRKRGAVHYTDCGRCNRGKGTQSEDSGKNGKWHGPLSREDVFKLAGTKQSNEPL